MPTRTCIHCGKTQKLIAEPRSSCCKKCRYIVNPPRLGTGGGWILHSKTGYMVGYVDRVLYYQHRYIMEQHLGRTLSSKETVHHINGDKTDNSLENLELISASEHARLHTVEKNTKNKQHVKAANTRWGNI